MKVKINSVGFTIDQKLVDFIEKKMNKLDNYYDKIISSDVYLKVENTSLKENKISEVKVNVPGDTFVVKKQGKSFEECIDNSIKPLERKIIKFKETR